MIKVSLIPNDFYVDGVNIEQVLRFCAKQKVKYVEIWALWGKSILDLNEDEISTLHELLDANGVKVASIQSRTLKVHPPGSSLEKPGSKKIQADYAYNIEMVDKVIDIAKEFDAKYIISYSYFTHLAGPKENLWKGVLSDYEAIIPKCKAANKTMVVECEGDTVVATIDDYMRLFEHFNSPHLKANFDLANLYGAQSTFSKEDFNRIKKHVEYFHVKDRTLRNCIPKALPKLLRQLLGSKPRVFGTGDVPWKKVLPAFAKAGFDGFLSVEPHVHGRTKYQKCKQCVINLQKMLTELNIEFE
ncbi:MAG: sugar phosphate isomerase/epimerase family protein [Candidatus Hodarchaeota archaeon]